MGATFTVVFESEVPPYGTLGADHPALFQKKDRLDRLVADKGLTPLGAFESYDPDDIDDFLDGQAPDDLPPLEWYPAMERLAAVNALYDFLEEHPNVLGHQPEVLDELTALADELAAAAHAGVRFRFAVVP
jgi:hypothetical protein